ncbi:class I SAM-dependent methyltransferase [Actinopolymorpha alba]|uniref:class I SAM-dependent methyltransferase n=1 Tax=Actinopolymorpha alba TaxID=533267 RepID=UPI00037D1A03|nr:50S ribosomal protein L11 methyltransferase [Actinopolymorpha alba]
MAEYLDGLGADPSLEELVRSQTRLAPVPGVPEIRLHLAADVMSLWERTEQAEWTGLPAASTEAPPPYWAFAWAGGQALARYLIDHPEVVAGRRVLDLAAGSGLVAIAAAKAGAATVIANDIEPLASAAAGLNARANAVELTFNLRDLLDDDQVDAEVHAQVILAGDIFYERRTADRVLPFLLRARSHGAAVLIGDPGRAYLPHRHLERLESYEMPVAGALEDAETKLTSVWRLRSD